MKSLAQRDAAAVSTKKNSTPRKIVWETTLRAVRTRLNLTLRQVARDSGVSISAVCHAEHGTGISLEIARAIADYFGMTELDLWPRKIPKGDKNAG